MWLWRGDGVVGVGVWCCGVATIVWLRCGCVLVAVWLCADCGGVDTIWLWYGFGVVVV